MKWWEYPHVVFSGKAMEYHGIRPAGSDIDVLAGESLWLALLEEGHIPVSAAKGGHKIVLENVEFFDYLGTGMTFSEVYADSIRVGNVNVMSLPHMLSWKLTMGRDKDLHDAESIRRRLTRV